jgi:hypothetical protein
MSQRISRNVIKLALCPGWITLWRGHLKLELMFDGVTALKQLKNTNKHVP